MKNSRILQCLIHIYAITRNEYFTGISLILKTNLYIFYMLLNVFYGTESTIY